MKSGRKSVKAGRGGSEGREEMARLSEARDPEAVLGSMGCIILAVQMIGTRCRSQNGDG